MPARTEAERLADQQAAEQARARAAERRLQEQHELRQSELPEVGSQGVVSQVLSGKRQLNARQIAALRRRFGVPADVLLR